MTATGSTTNLYVYICPADKYPFKLSFNFNNDYRVYLAMKSNWIFNFNTRVLVHYTQIIIRNNYRPQLVLINIVLLDKILYIDML